MNENESEISRGIRSESHIRMTDELKEWFKSQSDTPDKLVELKKDLAAHTYKPHWDACIEFARGVIRGFPKRPGMPTLFSIIAFLGMTARQIDSILPDLSNVNLHDIYRFDEGTYEPQGDVCACGHKIHNVIGVYNPDSGFRFSSGDCCCHKNELLSLGDIAKAKEEIGSKKKEYIKKRDKKECKGEGCEKFISKKDDSELCNKCIKKKEKLEAREIQNIAYVGKWLVHVGVYKGTGKTYADIVRIYPDFLVRLYRNGYWDHKKSQNNQKIIKFIELNLAHLI